MTLINNVRLKMSFWFNNKVEITALQGHCASFTDKMGLKCPLSFTFLTIWLLNLLLLCE